MFNIQEYYLFENDKLPDNFQFESNFDFTELNFYPDKKTRLNALLFKSKNPKGVVFYNHGNAGTLERWKDLAGDFLSNNYDYLVYDYRKYGKSKGKLSEKALFNDSLFIYDQLKKDYPENKIIVYGRSLGTGIAAHTASVRNPRTLILETPYYSLEDLIANNYRWIPRFLITYHFRTDLFLPQVKCPVYIFHGTKDEIVDYKLAVKLKSLLKPSDEFITIEGGKHSGLRHYDIYKEKLKQILSE